MKLIDLTGMKFERWNVRSRAPNNERKETMYHCICDCGTESVLMAANLRKGLTKSCGCLAKEIHTHHGHTTHDSFSPEYSTWASMIGRCTRKGATAYHHYGGRGITVCERWRKFENFLSDMGSRPSLKHSLDRIDGDGNYEPGNCRWATSEEQARNTKRSKKEFAGVTKGRRGTWRARIGVNKKSIDLGEFRNIDDALKARKEAELKYWEKESS